jgi:hypothetical protein
MGHPIPHNKSHMQTDITLLKNRKEAFKPQLQLSQPLGSTLAQQMANQLQNIARRLKEQF